MCLRTLRRLALLGVVIATVSRPTIAEDSPSLFTPAERSYWAFQPVTTAAPPEARGTAWLASPLDNFVLARLEDKGLQPTAPAHRGALLRRVTFDLIGLPPIPDEVDAFLSDDSPDAFAKVVDRLLGSPNYGERWGRHWLDVVRYADTTANDGDFVMRYAYRYRNYVINAFNADTPYDQFIVEQLAGDLLPQTNDVRLNTRRLIATGFLMLGPKALAEADKEQVRLDMADEQIDVTSRAMLGLTVACARCHDHKFDPIPTADYYSLAGVFRGVELLKGNSGVTSMWAEQTVEQKTPEQLQQIEETKVRIAKLEAAAEQRTAGSAADQAKREQEHHLHNDDPEFKEMRDQLDCLRRTLAEIEQQNPAITVMMPQEIGARSLKVHERGDRFDLGEEAPRRFLQVVAGEGQTPLETKQSGRLELARWIASGENPLTARVMVNRIWQGHFGKGLVPTSDNFGELGTPPSHPELLDWLAARFVESSWSIKKMHRLILLSSTYQQSSMAELGWWNAGSKPANLQSEIPSPQSMDPDNRLLWHFPKRRLEAEALRDAMLRISDQLDREIGGGGESMMKLFNDGDVVDKSLGLASAGNFSFDDAIYQTRRRSVYLPIVRNQLAEVLAVFDAADPSAVTATRIETTVPAQAMFMLNNRFVREQALAVAKQLMAAPLDDSTRMQSVFVWVLGRPPAGDEVDLGIQFVNSYATVQRQSGVSDSDSRMRAWQSYCQLLFCLNEFIYVE
jgi:hypothetical protein